MYISKSLALTIFLLGMVIGLAYPFAIDWALFGDATPCHTIKVYEDGSSIQGCSVRG